ncbi:hypothetical protein [Prevotella intermedia]|nr:hypothetical protein [Prevotella intermedia]
MQCNLYLTLDEVVVGTSMQEITTHMLQIKPKKKGSRYRKWWAWNVWEGA